MEDIQLEPHSLSISKSISWRGIATLTTFCISYAVTKNVMYATTIGCTEAVVKIFLFYFHERLWGQIRTKIWS